MVSNDCVLYCAVLSQEINERKFSFNIYIAMQRQKEIH